MSRHARADGGGYYKANHTAGEPPFTNKLIVEFIPVAAGPPACIVVLDKNRKPIAHLTDMQVREALDVFDDMAMKA